MIRTKFIEYDARRDPKTNRYCVCCQKDIAPGKPARWVFVTDQMEAVHPSDLAAHIANNVNNFGLLEMGITCARKFGNEWTMVEKPII